MFITWEDRWEFNAKHKLLYIQLKIEFEFNHLLLRYMISLYFTVSCYQTLISTNAQPAREVGGIRY